MKLDFENTLKPKPGRILLSNPFLMDEPFQRSVIFLCKSNSEDLSAENQETFGFKLNQPLKLDLNSLLPKNFSNEYLISFGGPVESGNLYYIHQKPLLISKSEHIDSNLYFGGDFNQIKDSFENLILQPKEIRFFAGYSGWGNEQLEEEIQEGSWLVIEKPTNFSFFEQHPESLWNKLMQTQGKHYKIMSQFPKNPAEN